MPSKGSALTIGTFDGVHRGHQYILRQVVLMSRAKKLSPTAITFHIPPRLYFAPTKESYLLTEVPEKISRLEDFGLKKVDVLNFNSKLSSLSAEEFFNRFVLKRHRAKFLTVGYNFAFGKGREGQLGTLQDLCKKHGIQFKVISQVKYKRKPVSSGLIRKKLREGSIEDANHLLGYPYRVEGIVHKGQALGRKIGYPTANIRVGSLKILPPGVFAVRAQVLNQGSKQKTYGGMCNIGYRPTIRASQKSITLEVHCFGLNKSLYKRRVRIEILKKLRKEKKFRGISELRKQLQLDSFAARKVLRAFTKGS